MEFDSSFGITDGNAFDVTTNVMALSNEQDGDTVVAFNFNTLNTSGFFATALNVTVPNVCPGGGVGCVGESRRSAKAQAARRLLIAPRIRP